MTIPTNAGPVNAIALAPGDRIAISGHEDGSLKLWDLQTGAELGEFQKMKTSVRSVAISADGRTAFSIDTDGLLELWNVATHTLMRSFQFGRGPDIQAAFSPERSLIIADGQRSLIAAWDPTLGELHPIATLEHFDKVLAISPDGRSVLIAAGAGRSQLGMLKLIDTAHADAPRTLESVSTPNAYQFAYGAISRDGNLALTASIHGDIELFHLADGKKLRTYSFQPGVQSISFASETGTALIGSGYFDTSRLLNLVSGKVDRFLAGAASCVVTTLDGRMAVSGGADGCIRVWELSGRNEVRRLSGHGAFLQSLAADSHGRIAISGDWEGKIIVWDLPTGRQLLRLAGHSGTVRGLVFVADGSSALSSGDEGIIKKWDLETGEEIRSFRGHTDAVLAVAIAPDAKTLWSASEDRTLKAWDIVTGEPGDTITLPDKVSSAAFNRAGTLAAIGSDQTLEIWDLATRRRLGSFQSDGAPITSVALSSDGRIGVSGCQSPLLRTTDRPATKSVTLMRQWDLATGEEVRTLNSRILYSGVTGVAISPDNRCFLSGSEDGNIRVWDATSGTALRTLTDPEIVIAVAFGRNSHMVLSGGVSKDLEVRDFSRNDRYIEFRRQFQELQLALQKRADDPRALVELGSWFAFRGMRAWAVELFEKARRAGGTVDPLLLARSYWELSGDLQGIGTPNREQCLRAAQASYSQALRQATREEERTYLQLCVSAVQREIDETGKVDE
jgi:WD40 repeat protein